MAESALHGVKFDGSVLSIGPSGGTKVTAVGVAIGHSLFAAILIAVGLTAGDGSGPDDPFVKNGTLAVVVGSTALIAIFLGAQADLRQKVTCGADGFSVPGKLWRRHRVLRWNTVAAIRTETSEKIDRCSVSPGSISLQRVMRREYDWPIAITIDGTVIEIGSLVTSGGSAGWHAPGPSGTQQRVELILRFRESLGIRWPALEVPPQFPGRGQGCLWEIARLCVFLVLFVLIQL